MTKAAFTGPYTDPNLTVRGPFVQTADPIVPAKTKSQVTEQVAVYDKAGTVYGDHKDNADFATLNAAAVPPAHASNAWNKRDPYKNSGMTGQTFFN